MTFLKKGQKFQIAYFVVLLVMLFTCSWRRCISWWRGGMSLWRPSKPWRRPWPWRRSGGGWAWPWAWKPSWETWEQRRRQSWLFYFLMGDVSGSESNALLTDASFELPQSFGRWRTCVEYFVLCMWIILLTTLKNVLFEIFGLFLKRSINVDVWFSW